MKSLNIASFFAALFFLVFSAHSQKNVKADKEKFRFGNITVQDLEQIPSEDSSATAVVLFDVGKTYFESVPDRIQLVHERHTRIKINSKAGYDWANGFIGLYHDESNAEVISNFQAATYNLEYGKVVATELKKDGIFDDEVVDWIMFKKFAMPNVKEGSIIEYKYRIYSQFIFNVPDWTFQQSIPVIYSKYDVDLPDFLHFKKEMKGYEPIRTEVKTRMHSYFNRFASNVETLTMVAENLPAFREEAYINSSKNYKSAIVFEVSTILLPGRIPIKIITDWEQISRNLKERERFGEILNKKSTVRDLVDSLTTSSKTSEEKVEAIYGFLTESFKWNENRGIYASQKVKKTLEDKSGNAADINLLLTLMLKTAGLSADPVIISTRDYGVVLPFFAPMLSKFNYVICQVKIDDKNVLVDATDRWRPYNMLPLRCINGVGRVIYENGSDWVTLKNNENSFDLQNLDFLLTEEGVLEGKVKSTFKNYSAFEARRKVAKVPYEEYVAEVKKQKENWDIKELKLENLDKVHEVFIENYEVKISNQVTKAGDKLYLDPMIAGKILENPFKLEERKFPVDYGFPSSKSYNCSIKLPPGYKLEDIVKPVIVTLPEKGGRFTYEVVETAGVLQIRSNFSIAKPLFLPEEYETLKSFYNHILTKQAEQIVLVKN